MTTPTNRQRKHFQGWRLAFLLLGISLCIVALSFGIITTNEYVFNGMVFVFGPIGLILALIAWLVPHPASNGQENLDIRASNPIALPTSITSSPTRNISSPNPPTITTTTSQNTPPTGQITSSSQNAAMSDTPLTNPVSTANNTPSVQPARSPDLAFPFNTPLLNPNEFYGRALARTTLINRTRIGSSTAIVGEQHIGKTWLLNYLMLTAPHDTMLGPNYRIGYLDAASPECHTISGFTTKALEVLDVVPTTPSPVKVDLKTLGNEVTKLYKQQEIRPVLCIDGFEGFGDNKEFDLNFFTILRTIATKGLVLITVTRTPLIDVVAHILGERSRTNPFLNIFYTLTLKPFNQKDADAFTQAKSMQVGFTESERQHLLERSASYEADGTRQWYPLKLQLVGHSLLEDKQAAQNNPNIYRPQDVQYWRDFEQRIKEQYESVIRT